MRKPWFLRRQDLSVSRTLRHIFEKIRRRSIPANLLEHPVVLQIRHQHYITQSLYIASTDLRSVGGHPTAAP